MSGSAVTGWGTALPPTIVTNADLEARLDTSDTWITERTGIRERRVGGSTGELAVLAGRAALDRAGLTGNDIDLLVLATTTPDQLVPATSADLQQQLGTRGGAFDLNAACAGFVYALVVANALLGTGTTRALVVASDTLSGITDQEDRSTAVLFGDGAGAVVLEEVAGEGRLLSWDLGADGSALPLLYCDHGGFLKMEGQEVFRRAVRAMVDSARTALEGAKATVADVALWVPHQANLRMIEAANSRLGLPLERTSIVLDRTGNTSSASIPLALAEAADDGRIQPGDLVLLSGFGAGMTWASAVLRWGP
ncbi:MAG: ketoacyl-ACP synthase III [Acidimicrobiales bacterium]|nr:ketoacyl-ACP synthase III [Acidimicrobiales bacterium]